MDKQKLKDMLKMSNFKENEYNYFMHRIDDFNADLLSALEQYVETGRIPQIEYNGWTIEKIMRHTYEDEMHAFFYLDNMMKNETYARCFGAMSFGIK